MKKSIAQPYYFLLIIAAASVGCSKHANPKPTPAALATSHWTFNGKSYKVTTGSYDATSNSLIAADDAGAVGGGNYVRVLFGSVVRPSTSITLTAVSIDTPPDPSNCTVQVGNIYDTYYINGHVSDGKTGDNVAVTVSPTGKLSASFSNISVTNGPTGTDTLTVSGMIVEN
jgi:hypothetical protein